MAVKVTIGAVTFNFTNIYCRGTDAMWSCKETLNKTLGCHSDEPSMWTGDYNSETGTLGNTRAGQINRGTSTRPPNARGKELIRTVEMFNHSILNGNVEGKPTRINKKTGLGINIDYTIVDRNARNYVQSFEIGDQPVVGVDKNIRRSDDYVESDHKPQITTLNLGIDW